MDVSGMPYMAANFFPFVSGCPVTSAVIFAILLSAQARMNIPEIVPSPMAAKPIGFSEAAWAKEGNVEPARARAENLEKSRRFMRITLTAAR